MSTKVIKFYFKVIVNLFWFTEIQADKTKFLMNLFNDYKISMKFNIKTYSKQLRNYDWLSLRSI